MNITHVNNLEIIHGGNFQDGHPTFIKIDGLTFKDRGELDKCEREIALILIAGEAVAVKVLHGDGTTSIYQPNNFKMKLGNFEVETCPERRPCRVLMNGHEPLWTEFSVTFREGETVLVKGTFQPR